MKRPPLSLTARLTSLYTAVSFTVLAGMSALVVYATQRNFVQQDTEFLEEKYQVVLSFTEERESPNILRLLDALERSHMGLHAQLRQGDRLVYGNPALTPPPHAASPSQSFHWQQLGWYLRGIERPLNVPHAGEPAQPPYQLILAVETNRKNQFVERMAQVLSAFIALATAVSGLLAWLAARAGLRPLRVMRERAAQVNAQQLDPRMPMDAVPAEMSGLAEALNHMLGRLQADFERLQQFSGDLAHELRTPLNSLLMQSQVVLAHPRAPAEYQEALASNIEELQRFARMIADMLLLAQTDQITQLPHTEPIALHTQADELRDFYDALADAQQMQIQIDGAGWVQGDRLMLRRALSNLIANALHYGAPNTRIRITIQQDAEHTRLAISNQGDTIAAEHLPRLFDRFYRIDQARQRPDAEGSGLGLAICQAIVTAHHGTIRVDSAQGQTRFELRFPSLKTTKPA